MTLTVYTEMTSSWKKPKTKETTNQTKPIIPAPEMMLLLAQSYQPTVRASKAPPKGKLKVN